MLRKVIFWTHLACGLITGLVVLSLSITGVILTYERQLESWLTEPKLTVSQGVEPLVLEDVLERAAGQVQLSSNVQVVLNRTSPAIVELKQGRRHLARFNRYIGDPVDLQRLWVQEFFGFVTRFHRWFAVGEDARPVAKFIVGTGNLVFLFLVASGLYLWLPPIWRAQAVRLRTWFVRKPASTMLRDYNWHHVLGIWMAVPLLVLIVTGSVFSFRWTGDVVYAALGVERAVSGTAERGGQGRGRGGGPTTGRRPFSFTAPPGMLSLDDLFDAAAAYAPDWRELALSLPRPRQAEATVLIDRGNGGQPTLRETISLDRASGEVIDSVTFDQLQAAQRIRGTIRFLHTGEYFGLVGQTVAGLASLAAVIMVYTGFALAWRRLVDPWLKTRQQHARAQAGQAANASFLSVSNQSKSRR